MDHINNLCHIKQILIKQKKQYILNILNDFSDNINDSNLVWCSNDNYNIFAQELSNAVSEYENTVLYLAYIKQDLEEYQKNSYFNIEECFNEYMKNNKEIQNN